jgi:predicted alpha/beta superfamily hydrolase
MDMTLTQRRELTSMAYLAAVVIALPITIAAQQNTRTITLGESHTIQSAVMGENREILVSLPDGYQRTRTQYPVLFVLDGSSHLLHATATTQFLAAARNRIPEMLVVAVPNTNRNRDNTPGAGAVKFERFFAEELIPWVERTYRASAERLVVGHSLTGSFVVHALLNRPDLFDAYIAVSPPIWRYDSLMADVRSGLERAAQQGAALYLSVGERENENLLGGIARFDAFLRSGRLKAPTWSYAVLKDEDHSSTANRSLYNALEARYADWRFPFFEDTTELEAAGGLKELEAHYNRFSARFGYRAPPPDTRLLQVGRIYLTAGRHADVVLLARRYMNDYPAMSEQLINQTGYDYLRIGKLEEGVRTFRQNVELFPSSMNVYDSLGDGYCRLGDTTAAVSSFGQAARMAETRAHPRLRFYQQKVERGCRQDRF